MKGLWSQETPIMVKHMKIIYLYNLICFSYYVKNITGVANG